MNATLILSTATVCLMVLCILFAGFLWTVDSKNRLSNRLLAGMLLVLAISISAFWYGFYFEVDLTLDRIRDDINILASPLLFLFISAALHSDFKLRLIHLLHILPFIIITSLLVPGYYLVSHGAKVIFLENYYQHPEVKVTNVVRFITPVLYYLWSYVVLYRAKQLILENHSDDKMRLYNWLWQLNTLSVFIFIVSIAKGILRFQVSPELFQFVRLGMVLSLIGFLIWLVMKALHHPLLFRGLDGSLPSVSQILQEREITGTDVELNEDKAELERIQSFMSSEAPYLDASLSLQKLARLLDISPQDLSLLINHKLGKHFFDFVNEYRIRMAQEVLIDPRHQSKTILEIMYEVGFNSKSSFNTAFKKHTDMTPTQYRKGFTKSL